MKALVLGSSGFLGSALMVELQARGMECLGLSSRDLNLAETKSIERLCGLLDERTVLFVACRAQQKEGWETVFYKDIAILTHVAHCVEKRRLAKCVYYSSLSIYGSADSHLAITEETPTAPDSFYGISKFVGEVLLGQAAAKSGTPILILRPPMVYGPGDTSTAYGPTRFIRSLLEHGEIRVFGDGSELRGYIFIRDLVRITLELVLGGREGTFCLDSGQSYSFMEMMGHLRRASEREFQVRHIERDRPRIDQKINPSKLLKALPGFSFMDFAQGLEEAYRYFSHPSVSSRASVKIPACQVNL